MLIDVLRLLAAIAIAFIAGKLISKLKLPSILGWLIAGMVIGPHALGLLGSSVLDSQWFGVLESILECTFGLMIGTELIWKQMKTAGPQILITTITESLGTFLVVSLVFGVIFWSSGIPLYLAFMFGGIALATAPAPSLSVVNDLKTSGPVTRTLIPMAALDDLVGALVFFLVIALVSAHISTAGIPVSMVLFLVFLPVLIGILTGFITGKMLQHTKTPASTLTVMLIMLLVSAGIGFAINSMLPAPVLNFMLIGMSFSAVFANMITEEQLSGMMKVMDPVIGFAMIVVILDLGAPLDYHLIFGAGIYTAIYIIARAIGKYSGAYFGAAITHAPDTVKRYLGFTLLPHSGVSLVFTGIAVSVLEGPAPECASIIQGTIAAAAVINEIIAVFMAKKGFEWAGELHKAEAGGAA
ncbi:MAG TPA: cation:proton antiporter [Candidatus Intestinimonas stercoravium]|uniref:cation:proton antiporter n=1 Tax=uncultured Intestinimonas sp. TaxID=1689265 RepID=UPI001FA457BC|nr:cation:proton antiporter [uncultured Intestinimonas sp.]HJA64480.1 cation:proton antiporter [Candidatus Intestinimonas stercoravium]